MVVQFKLDAFFSLLFLFLNEDEADVVQLKSKSFFVFVIS